MYVILTTVRVKPGTIDHVRDLFADAFPKAIDGQTDFHSVKYSADRVEDKITILEFWRSKEAYRELSNSDGYQEAISEISQFFTGPMRIQVNEILFEM